MSAEKPLPSFIAAQLNYVHSHCPLPIKVPAPKTPNPNPKTLNPNFTHTRSLSPPSPHPTPRNSINTSRYRFTLSIPFCLVCVKWDFMYNAMCPSVPLDIVFGTEEEGFNPLLVIAGGGRNGEERKSCLRSWSGKDQSKLLDLVNEFRELYLEYHAMRVGELDDD